MRFPRASSVIVALSTAAGAATIALVIGQLTPVDRAGTELPLPPIAAPGESLPTLGVDETPSPGAADEATSGSGSSPSGATAGDVTVVSPATPEPVDPAPAAEPEPSSPPSSTPAPTSPGNSGSAPGHSGTHPGSGSPNGNANDNATRP